MRTTALGMIAGCLLAALAPETARAQGGHLIFQAGYYVPTKDLGTLRESGLEEAIEFGKRERSLAYSLGLQLPIAGPFSGRATLVYGTAADIAVGAAECADCGARNSVLGATAALVFRPLPGGVPVQPYLMGGGGVKHYDIEPLTDAWADLRDQTRRTLLAGAGIELRLGPLVIVTELSDYISPVFAKDDSEATQHDLFVTLGLMLGSG